MKNQKRKRNEESESDRREDSGTVNYKHSYKQTKKEVIIVSPGR